MPALTDKESSALASIPSIFIDGEAGTTGLGIRDRLRDLPVRVLSIDAARRRDPAARLELMRDADLVVLCLPDDAAREAVALSRTVASPPRILDASTAHRTDPEWCYGFPEMHRNQPDAIAGASLVSNPGCYPTGAIALLRPLIEAGLLPGDLPLTVNAVSGYSGGGRAMIEAHERDGGPAFFLYGLSLEHKHVPEIRMQAGLARRPIFVPSVGHFPRGMIVSIPIHGDALPDGVSAADLRGALADWYAGAPRVTVSPELAPATLTADALAGSDGMELRVHGNDEFRHVLLTARLDNLGKGASGAAIQNIALMLGLDLPSP